jgi:hypothetical protein
MSTPYTAEQIIALLDADTSPAAGILAVADLREQRAKAATAGLWHPRKEYPQTVWQGEGDPTDDASSDDFGIVSTTLAMNPAADAEHIAAEANPAHALAAVRRWRGVVERHTLMQPAQTPWCRWCDGDEARWPCPDLVETADEARAYLGGDAS